MIRVKITPVSLNTQRGPHLIWFTRIVFLQRSMTTHERLLDYAYTSTRSGAFEWAHEEVTKLRESDCIVSLLNLVPPEERAA